MITLKKISRLSGFSVSTVSKALNDKHDINIDTKRIIQEIASKNNYKPNKNALALRVNRSFIIAVIVPQINDILYSELLSDMHRSASKIGYRIMVFQSFEEIIKLEKCLEDVNDGSVDAAVVLSNNPIGIGMPYKGELDVYVEYIHILKNHSKADLKGYCISVFEKLLNKIN
jgi:LacI family transcriptional regulator